MGRKRIRTRDVIIVLILLALVYFVGFGMGAYSTAKVVAKIASGFVDPELVRQAIFQYKNNIGQCFPSNFTL